MQWTYDSQKNKYTRVDGLFTLEVFPYLGCFRAVVEQQYPSYLETYRRYVVASNDAQDACRWAERKAEALRDVPEGQALCPGCDRVIFLNRDGSLWAHVKNGPEWCDMSYKQVQEYQG